MHSVSNVATIKHSIIMKEVKTSDVFVVYAVFQVDSCTFKEIELATVMSFEGALERVDYFKSHSDSFGYKSVTLRRVSHYFYID